MVTIRVVSLVVCTLLVGGLAFGCQQPSTSDVDQTEEGVLRLGTVEAVDTVERSVAPNERPLVVNGFRGPITLRGDDQQTANLRFIRRGRGEDTESARGVLEDVTITESGSEDAYTYTLETDGGSYAAVDVDGTVPRSTEVRIEQATGPVSIDGVEGPLTIAHEHGPVTVRGAAASMEVTIENGDVDVGVREVPPDASISLRTKNGDVTLHLPATASIQLRAETRSGLIRTRGLTMTGEQFMPRNAGGRYNAQIGPGEASVEVETQNGSVLIQSRDVRAAEGAPVDTADAEQGFIPPSDTTVAPEAPSDTVQVDTTASDTS